MADTQTDGDRQPGAGDPAARAPGRARNPRGQGRRLREEIVRAAAALLDRTGDAQAVTLRAVAREVGIAAPSIYAHFPDREAVLLAVVEDAFRALEAHLAAAGEPATDPVARLREVCARYLDFALRWPQRYRVMFSGVWPPPEQLSAAPPDADSAPPPASAPHPADADADAGPLVVGDAAFRTLVQAVRDCADLGRSGSRDAFADAAVLWVGLHGLAQLRPAVPLFPWPADVLDVLVDRLAVLPAAEERR